MPLLCFFFLAKSQEAFEKKSQICNFVSLQKDFMSAKATSSWATYLFLFSMRDGLPREILFLSFECL